VPSGWDAKGQSPAAALPAARESPVLAAVRRANLPIGALEEVTVDRLSTGYK